ncbi:hypothetical protein TREMEDRAFT_60621 [Tremella mesenterica DSM 1558]|uniref:uncharacterized protein n=1 Tax=Tremella mesenterica (strain ATCC 24925 / CBS 8224 / DSM 1558 / NBRC 9311 / NRRL Y-6157 / RJB 2259-6 / UBC 559-6) TaxID=578456 RepID=UPI0003F49713|nr:uncharacterized protein TREMEDRAFT_60621 [Tremella mesenterica DSM 1558]EIW71703.1 hypothetical protein TREMEDRAFT_60621 [Tremella mesenterica DSM 1558]
MLSYLRGLGMNPVLKFPFATTDLVIQIHTYTSQSTAKQSDRTTAILLTAPGIQFRLAAEPHHFPPSIIWHFSRPPWRVRPSQLEGVIYDSMVAEAISNHSDVCDNPAWHPDHETYDAFSLGDSSEDDGVKRSATEKKLDTISKVIRQRLSQGHQPPMDYSCHRADGFVIEITLRQLLTEEQLYINSWVHGLYTIMSPRDDWTCMRIEEEGDVAVLSQSPYGSPAMRSLHKYLLETVEVLRIFIFSPNLSIQTELQGSEDKGEPMSITWSIHHAQKDSIYTLDHTLLSMLSDYCKNSSKASEHIYGDLPKTLLAVILEASDNALKALEGWDRAAYVLPSVPGSVISSLRSAAPAEILEILTATPVSDYLNQVD